MSTAFDIASTHGNVILNFLCLCSNPGPVVVYSAQVDFYLVDPVFGCSNIPYDSCTSHPKQQNNPTITADFRSLTRVADSGKPQLM